MTEEQLLKRRAYSRKHYLANKEQYALRHSQYYLKNRDKMLADGKIWAKVNPEKLKKIRKRFFVNHPGIQTEYQRRYQRKPHFRLKSKADHANQRAPGTLRLRDIQRLYEDNIKKYGTLTCYICSQPIEFGQDTLDHNVPVTRGGINEYSNLGVAHSSCNHKKHGRTLQEYLTKVEL